MRNLLSLLFVVLLYSNLSAQKSSPVMGDAATLIDLLKKDYNTSNPDSRDEDINADRGKVIAFFKSYLTKNEVGDFEKKSLKDAIDYKTSFEELNKLKETLVNFNKQEIKVESGKLKAIFDEIAQVQKEIEDKKKAYYLAKYNHDLKVLTDIGEAYKTENTYINYIILKFIEKYKNLQVYKTDTFAEKNGYSSVQKSIPFLGGDMAFETIIDGLSRFLAKRIKEELTIHAIGKIKTYLEHPTPENYCYELLAVMPTTTNYLKQFDADQLLNFTDELKQYIEQDLNNILENAVNLKDTPRLKSYIAKYPDLEFAFEGLAIIPQLSKIKSPIDYFELLENSRTLANWRSDTSKITKYNIAQSLRLASMLAYSMTIVESGELKFASVDFVSNYGNEPNFYFLYFGLLHQQNTKYFNVKFKKSDNSDALFDIKAMMTALPAASVTNATNNFIFLKNNLVAIAQNAEKVYSQGLAIKKKNKNNEEVKYDEIYSFINDFIGFSEEVVTTADLLLDTKYSLIAVDLTIDTKNEIDLKNKLTPYFTVAKIANNVVMDLHQKKYANAIVRAIEIPLSFKINNSSTITVLNTIKNTVSNQNDLFVISKLYNPNLNALSDDKKVAYLTALNSDLTILKLKISEKKELKALYDLLNQFNLSSTTLTTANVNTEIAKLAGIKTELKTKYETLLSNFGYKKEEVLKKLDALFKDNKLNQTVKDAIKLKLTTYTKAVFESVVLNENTDPKFIENELKDLLTTFVPQLLQSNTKITDNKAIKLIHFFNDISASKDGKDVEKAIDAFALPVGSSSLKEKAFSYFSINSFPGIVGGFEFSHHQKDANSIGFTAPVGFYFQPWKSGKKGNVLGIFLPIIDIAAPVRLRLDGDNDTKTLPDFNFNDIFSPGLYFTYGIGNSPFAINLGGQYGPKLRDIPDGNNGFTSVDSYRINLGFTIDIPLLTLASKYKD